MSSEIGAVGKGARAYFTLERFFACVSPHVALKQPGSTEALAAYFALARQRVRSNVHFECSQ
ncbi:hypothetical protein BpHYR1_011459 [Brachionus plicatilis]|uniref:Uncharacterized protein n=1 Tax=Brachionus plicatilis TaxID=10195 RepID=A0A3M7QEB7_BRAPC|nr:hypothetical protein BpHYR1_011459 [Brachionus plicatilis]